MKLSSTIFGSTAVLVIVSTIGYSLYNGVIDAPNYKPGIQTSTKEKAVNKIETLPLTYSSSMSAIKIDQSHIVESQPTKPSDLLSKEEALDMIAWQQERGYPSFTLDGEIETPPYEHYSHETLQALANGGDPEAMFILGRKQLFGLGNHELAKSLFIEASVHGYTATFGHLGNISISKANIAKNSNKLAEAREHQKDAYAWFEAGILRGDKALGLSKSMYNVKFNSEELQEISALANQYYSELATKREELNLPPFNNDYPAALDIIYAQ